LVSWRNAGAAEAAEEKARTVADVDHRLIFERVSAPCLVLLPDAPHFTVVAANDAYLALARSTRSERVGKALIDSAPRAPYLLAESQFEALRASLEQTALTRSVTRLLLEDDRSCNAVPPALGMTPLRSRWAVINTPVDTDVGELRYIVHRVEPIGSSPSESAERERTEELECKLDQRTRELEKVLAELAAFSYSVSHDLRAPLRAIDGFTQALSQDYADVLDAGARHYLDRVQAGAQRMSELIDDMLELSRIQRVPLRRSRVDVSELCSRIVNELTKKHPERKIEALIAPGLSAYADAHLMRVALEKLLENAWKFTAQRSPARVVVGREPGDASTLSVADDGVGFDMAHASRLFSPFQRLHKVSEFDGTGIGLAVAQCIVSRHGGRIWAEAEAGKGAKFCFCVGADHE
jgi:signal transduction histidine kinase